MPPSASRSASCSTPPKPATAACARKCCVNGVKRRVGELAGLVNVVLFLPQDLTIVEGSPSDRRRYVDLPSAR